MFDSAGFLTAEGQFIIAGIRLAVWMLMMGVPLLLAGVNIRESFKVITQPEATFFGLYAIGAAIAASGLFS
jgi:hypothetical protein